MKQLLLGAGICLATAVTICYATMGGQYSVNIHFVPPLVTGTCSVAQFWNPPNVTCALCFCMTGTLSRCIPQPGCVPNNSTNNNATTTTPAPVNGTEPVANVQPGQETQHMTAAPGETTTTAGTTPTTAPTTAATTTVAAASTAAPPAMTNLIRKRRGFAKVERKF